jgi:hypothetical protein
MTLGKASHTFTDDIQSVDGDNHDFKCTDCTTRGGSAAHTSNNAHAGDCTLSDVCTGCGYNYGNAHASHTLTDDIQSVDGSHHDFKCTDCTTRGGDTAHTANNTAAVAANCTLDLVCDCGYVMMAGKADHDWGEWEITTPATATETGEETKTCKDCEATETRNIYAITATAGTGGSITPSGVVQTVEGGEQPFKLSATSGYRLSDVKVDGVSVGAVSSYTFTDVTEAHTIEAI